MLGKILLAVFGFSLLLWLFLLLPSLRKHKDLSLLKGRQIAHRGLHDLTSGTPENSLAAFREAVERGYMIETDFHVTRDGHVAVFHDDDLKRMCGIDKRPEDLTLSELQAISLAGTSECIPSAEECLALVDGRVPLLIELKCTDGKTAKRLCKAVVPLLDAYQGPYLIQSFYPPAVGWFKRHRPEVCRGQLAAGFYNDSLKLRLLGSLIFNYKARPDFISYGFDTRNNLFRRFCCFLGAGQTFWTIHSQEDLDKLPEDAAGIFEGFVPKV